MYVKIQMLRMQPQRREFHGPDGTLALEPASLAPIRRLSFDLCAGAISIGTPGTVSIANGDCPAKHPPIRRALSFDLEPGRIMTGRRGSRERSERRSCFNLLKGF